MNRRTLVFWTDCAHPMLLNNGLSGLVRDVGEAVRRSVSLIYDDDRARRLCLVFSASIYLVLPFSDRIYYYKGLEYS